MKSMPVAFRNPITTGVTNPVFRSTAPHKTHHAGVVGRLRINCSGSEVRCTYPVGITSSTSRDQQTSLGRCYPYGIIQLVPDRYSAHCLLWRAWIPPKHQLGVALVHE